MIKGHAREILNKYFGEILIESTFYSIVPDTESDAAGISLIVPKRMLREYFAIPEQRVLEDFGAEFSKPPQKPAYSESEVAERFWRESGLLERLEGKHDKYHGQGVVQSLSDILDYLHGDVIVEAKDLNNPDYVEITVEEVLEKIPEDKEEASLA